jgi:hypothetical protein
MAPLVFLVEETRALNRRGADTDPILVFGLPRSGTSWLGKIFDSHPETLYRHEPDKRVRLADVPVVFPVERLGAHRDALDSFLQRVLANRSPGVTGKLPAFRKSYRSLPRHLARTTLAAAAKALPRRLCERVQVPDLIDPGHPGPRLVWKSINSVGRLGALARLLPEAKALLLLRHPCGQIASILRGHAAGKFHGPLPSEHYRIFEMLVETEPGRAHGLTLDALRALQPVERMAWRWVLFLEKAIADLAGLANCRLLRYEDLCAAPFAGSRELLGFAGLGWHPQTEAFLRESTGGEDEQYFGLRKDPRRSAGKWQQELPEPDVRRIFDVIGRSPVGRLYLEEKGERATLFTAEPSWPAFAGATALAEGLSSPS